MTFAATERKISNRKVWPDFYPVLLYPTSKTVLLGEIKSGEFVNVTG